MCKDDIAEHIICLDMPERMILNMRRKLTKMFVPQLVRRLKYSWSNPDTQNYNRPSRHNVLHIPVVNGKRTGSYTVIFYSEPSKCFHLPSFQSHTCRSYKTLLWCIYGENALCYVMLCLFLLKGLSVTLWSLVNSDQRVQMARQIWFGCTCNSDVRDSISSGIDYRTTSTTLLTRPRFFGHLKDTKWQLWSEENMLIFTRC